MTSASAPTRQLCLIDIENLADSPSITETAAVRVAAVMSEVVDVRAGDLTIVAASHRNGVATGLALPGARLVCRSGTDGADLALAAAFRDQPFLDTFAGVIIASGDGFFVETATTARRLGLRVTVVARRNCLSRRLAAAADIINFLGEAA